MTVYPHDVLSFPPGCTRELALERLRQLFSQVYDDQIREIQTGALLSDDAEDGGVALDVDSLDGMLAWAAEQKADFIERALRQAVAVLDALERRTSQRP